MNETAATEGRFANSGRDWAARAVIFVVFLFFGAGKFNAAAQTPWVILYDQIGFGQWFRYATAVLEIAGAFLVMVSPTVMVGLAVLALTMTGALLIDVIVLHRFVDAFFPFSILCGMVALGMHRRRV